MAREPPEEEDRSESEGDELGGGAKTTPLLETPQEIDVTEAAEDNTVRCPCGVNEVSNDFPN